MAINYKSTLVAIMALARKKGTCDSLSQCTHLTKWPPFRSREVGYFD